MSTNLSSEDNRKNTKRIVALVGVVLIGIMVLATLLCAFFDPTGVYFRSCLIVTIALPIAIWVFMWAYGAMMHKHTPASFDLNLGGNESESESESISESESKSEPESGDGE
ncbi:MAG: hypothetical protein J5509_11485 [Lachnospiraceae bacterium]|nr:hypothetical protein [Lachnospiraceae bacterium]